MQKKFSGKSMIDANYTFSRGLTNAQNDYSSAPQNTYNLAAEYGPSVYNRNDILSIDGVWELPWYREQHGLLGHIAGGWEFSGLYVVNSGLPLTATMSGGGTVSYNNLTSIYNGQTNGGTANDAAGLGILGPSAASLRPNRSLTRTMAMAKLLSERGSTGSTRRHSRRLRLPASKLVTKNAA